MKDHRRIKKLMAGAHDRSDPQCLTCFSWQHFAPPPVTNWDMAIRKLRRIGIVRLKFRKSMPPKLGGHATRYYRGHYQSAAHAGF